MKNFICIDNCTGCRSCELACSYHHQKIFAPSISSIRVKRSEKDGEFGIIIYRESAEGHLACNCPENDESCLNYCPTIARGELKAILESD